MARLLVSLLGPFQVIRDGESVTDFESNKARALLAYLVVEAERPHHREKLASLLWPNLPDSAARGNLRHALSSLRKTIGDRSSPGRPEPQRPCLQVTRHTIQFDCASSARVDVHTFTQNLAAETNTPQSIQNLEEGVALYQGDFLEGFSIGDSASFDEWLLLRREQFQRMVLVALRRLASYYEGNGEYEQALPYAWRQVDLEPWQEEAHRQVMRLLAADGNRGTALAQYQACREALAAELDVAPAAETTRLYEQIRDGNVAKFEVEEAVADGATEHVQPVADSPQAAAHPGTPRLADQSALKAPQRAPPGQPAVWRWSRFAPLVLILAAILLLAGENLAGDLNQALSFPGPIPERFKILRGCGQDEPWRQLCVANSELGHLTPVADRLIFEFIDGMSWSPDGQQIVFSGANEPGRQDQNLYIINADGTGLRQLTNGPEHENNPVWSPDGDWVVFHRNCTLWRVRPDGSNLQQLWGVPQIHCVGGIAWSPDSMKIAVLSNIDPGNPGPRQIWVINRDGSNPQAVYTFGQQPVVGQLAWSPDGQQLFCACESSNQQRFYLITVDGSEAAQEVDGGQVPFWWFSDCWPQWG